MNIKQLVQDEDAVSPVIGVILMVAITVILAAVIGTFVLGLGDQVQSSAPNANFDFEYSGDFVNDNSFDGASDSRYGQVEVSHNGGQDVTADNIEVQIGSETAYDGSTGAAASSNDWSVESNNFGSGDDSVATGASVELIDGDSDDQTGSDVRVIWTSPNGDSSNTIGSSTVPS